MENAAQQGRPTYDQPANRLAARNLALVAGYALLFGSCAVAREGQQGATNPLPNRPIVIPNRSLSPDEMKELADKNSRRRNFNAANAARKLLIDEEATRLLILARDLKAKTATMGSDPPSPVMLREAAVIEFLANDVKEKMKLTVIPD
jgi:hypothetical protein